MWISIYIYVYNQLPEFINLLVELVVILVAFVEFLLELIDLLEGDLGVTPYLYIY